MGQSLVIQIILALLFLIIFTLIFYPQGYYLLRKTNLKDHEIILLSLVPMIVIFTLESLVLAFLNLRFLLLPVNVGLSGLVLLSHKLKIFNPFSVFGKYRLLTILLILAVIVQGFINFPSGFRFEEGLLFWSSQGHDGIWHVALMEEVAKGMPLQNPLISGFPLYNYHYLIDVFMGELVRVLHFASIDAYFRFFPVVFAILINLSVFSFVYRWRKNIETAYWAMFFTFGTGSFGYVVNYLKGGGVFGGETVFWSSQNNTILGNPPHAVSFIFLVTSLLSLNFYFNLFNPFTKLRRC